MKTALALALVLTGCCCPLLSEDEDERAATPTATAYDAQFVETHLARLREAAGCAGTPSAEFGYLCDAANGWANGTAAAIPGDVPARVGITTWIPTQGSVQEAHAQQMRLSVLAFTGGPETMGGLTSPGGNDPGLTMVLNDVIGHLRGSSVGPIAVHSQLDSFLTMQSISARYRVASTGSGWQLQGGSFADLRRVGDRWVAIEVPRNAPQGLYFSVFLDEPTQRVGL